MLSKLQKRKFVKCLSIVNRKTAQQTEAVDLGQRVEACTRFYEIHVSDKSRDFEFIFAFFPTDKHQSAISSFCTTVP